MKKVLCLFVLLFIMVGLCSCDDLPTNEPAGSENTDGDNENNGGSNSDGAIDEKPAALGIPSNLKFEYSTGMLSWDAVTDATSYVVSANGNEFVSTEKSIYLPIIAKTTNIKVKAKNASTESNWTNDITYTVDENDDFNNLKLFILGELQSDTELLDIISYNSRLSPFTIICRVKIEGEEKLVRLSYPIPSNLHGTPLINIINSVDKESGSAYEIFDIVEYDSFKKIMDDELCAQLKNFKNNGYEIECLASYTTRYNIYNGLAKFYIHSTIKAKGDNHIKYYGMSTTVNSEIGDGSAPYLENLKDARISTSYYSIGEAEAKKMYYESKNGISSYGFNTSITDADISRFDGDPKQISAPTNLKYDYRTGMLSWNSKGEVSQFIISANNNEYTSTEHSMYLPISDKATVFKVKAQNDQHSSEWSSEITYNVGTDDEFNSLKLFVLGELKADTKLLDIVHYNKTSYQGSYSFVIHCRVEITGEIKFVRLEYSLTQSASSYASITDILELIDEDKDPLYYIYGAVEYDSLKAIIDNNLSNPFTSSINNGYEVEYLTSYTTQYFYINGQPRFFVYAIAKLTKDTEVKYYGLRMIVKSDAGEGSQAYIENLSTATISSSVYLLSNDIVEKILLEAENNATAIGTNTAIADADISRYDQDVKIISTPTNLKYNSETGMLSWNSEGLIESFIISVNGNEYISTEHSLYLPISAKTSTIKVKAQNDEYTTDWSTEIAYTLNEDDKFNTLKLLVLETLKDGSELLGILYYDVYSYQETNSLIVVCLAEMDDTEKLVRLTYSLTARPNSYDELLNAFALIDDEVDVSYEVYNTVEYDSFKEITDNNLVNLFTSSINSGYEVEYITSHTARYNVYNGEARFSVYAIAKLTKDTEVKYSGVRFIVYADLDDYSKLYIDNLSDSKITSFTYSMDTDVAEKMIYEAENNITAAGTNTNAVMTRYDDDIKKLSSAPTSVEYDYETGMLSWNSKGLIDTFVVSANGKEYTTNEHSLYLPISANTTTIKVKAQNDEYTSDWSTTITYTVAAADDFNNLKVFVLGELKSDTELLEIMSYSFSNIITIICRVEINNVEKIVRLAYSVNYGSSDGTIAGSISLINREGSSAYEIFSTVEYDSLDAILDNDITEPFASEKNNGYEVEYLYSYTTKYFISNEQARFFVYALAKLEKDDEVIYKALRLTIKATEGEGSETYIENLSTATFSQTLYTMSNDIVERMLFEAESNITAAGTNTTIIDDDITIY